MDVLDDILTTLDLRGVLYFRTDLSGSWGVTVPDYRAAARFHLVVQGQCHVQIQDGVRHVLNAGDIILIPRGRSHILSSNPVDTAPPLEQTLADCNYDGQGVFVAGEGDDSATTQMVCGHFSFRPGGDHPILRALPTALKISSADRARFSWLDELLRLLARNVFRGQLGAHSTVIRLSEIVFLEMLRSGAENETQLKSVFEAFTDSSIGESLQLIHNQTDRPWTIATLASQVGMSRSRFAERFKDLVGIGPMSYLTEWRLQKSLALLNDAQVHVGVVANKAGYQSAAAFTRAFSSRFGVSPSMYRKDVDLVQA